MTDSSVEIPLFPLRTVLFPGGPLPLRIFETRYTDMIGKCLKEDRGFGVIAIRSDEQSDAAEIHQVGTLARIVDWYQFDDGLLGITALGETKFLLRSLRQQEDGLNLGRVDFLEQEVAMSVPDEFHPLIHLLQNILTGLETHYRYIEKSYEDASWVGCRLAEVLPLSLEQKQMCLELVDPVQRMEVLTPLVEYLKQ